MCYLLVNTWLDETIGAPCLTVHLVHSTVGIPTCTLVENNHILARYSLAEHVSQNERIFGSY